MTLDELGKSLQGCGCALILLALICWMLIIMATVAINA